MQVKKSKDKKLWGMFIFRRKNETGAVTFYQPPDMIWWQVRQDWEMVVFSFVSDAWSGSRPVQYPGGDQEGCKYAILIQTILARSIETVPGHLRPHGLGQVRHARDRQRVFRHRRRGQSDQDLGPHQRQTEAVADLTRVPGPQPGRVHWPADHLGRQQLECRISSCGTWRWARPPPRWSITRSPFEVSRLILVGSQCHRQLPRPHQRQCPGQWGGKRDDVFPGLEDWGSFRGSKPQCILDHWTARLASFRRNLIIWGKFAII